LVSVGTAVSDDTTEVKDEKMIFEITKIDYPVRFANYQRNSLVPSDVRTRWEPIWQRAFADVDSQFVMSPRAVLIAGGLVGVQGAAELLVYDSAGEFKFSEKTANPSPLVFGTGGMAFVHPSTQLIYQDYSQNRLGRTDPAPRLDERAYALLFRPSLDEILAVIQFTGVPKKQEKKHFVYQFVRETLTFKWKHEFPGKANHALLANDAAILFVISGEQVQTFRVDDGKPGEPFSTGLIRPISASLNSVDQLVILGRAEDNSKSPIALSAFSISGEKLWSIPTHKPQRSQPPASGTDGRIYLVDGMQLRCVKDGSIMWSGLLKSEADSWVTVTRNNFALVINGQMLLLYDADGRLVFESLITRENEFFRTPPAIDASGRIYVTGNRHLYCFD